MGDGEILDVLRVFASLPNSTTPGSPLYQEIRKGNRFLSTAPFLKERGTRADEVVQSVAGVSFFWLVEET